MPARNSGGLGMLPIGSVGIPTPGTLAHVPRAVNSRRAAQDVQRETRLSSFCHRYVQLGRMATDPGPLRIGEFARRVGVNPELLRAWERRYGLLLPVRSSGGFRLYTADDGERVARMRQALDAGLSAAEAARVALQESRPSDSLLDDAAARLLGTIREYDE